MVARGKRGFPTVRRSRSWPEKKTSILEPIGGDSFTPGQMAKVTYKDLIPVGTTLIVGAVCFGLGVIYGNWPYSVETLYRYNTDAFDLTLRHYQMWANTPPFVHYVFHAVMGLGLIGCFIKLYKPDPESQYFEYGTLALVMLSIVVYLTNLRTGINSCISGNWGEVDQNTGLNVMAASQVMVAVILLGVLVLQGGLYYAELEDRDLQRKFYAEQEKEAQQQAEVNELAAEDVANEAKDKKKLKLKLKLKLPAGEAKLTGTAKKSAKKRA